MKPEEQLHRACVQLLWVYETFGRLTFAHCPNGGSRHPAEAAKLKAMGVRAGVPDLLIWTPAGGHFAIELKAGRGTESDAQVLWRSTLESLGHRCYVCWSLDEVEAVLRLEGIRAVGRVSA